MDYVKARFSDYTTMFLSFQTFLSKGAEKGQLSLPTGKACQEQENGIFDGTNPEAQYLVSGT